MSRPPALLPAALLPAALLPALLALPGCADPDPVVTLTGAGAAPLAAAPPGRSLRRMDIDQLKASIEAVTGGIGWTEEQDDGSGTLVDVDLFRALSLTLGKPDYLDVTEEDRVPGLLFQKFLDDAAKSACTKLILREQGQAASSRVFVTGTEFDASLAADPAGMALTMRAALLRFHGRAPADPGLAAADDPRLSPWLALQDQVARITGSQAEGWEMVCVALITHPDFYSY